MKKINMILLALLASVLTSAAEDVGYKIIYDRDTVIKTRVEGFSLSSRSVRRIIRSRRRDCPAAARFRSRANCRSRTTAYCFSMNCRSFLVRRWKRCDSRWKTDASRLPAFPVQSPIRAM